MRYAMQPPTLLTNHCHSDPHVYARIRPTPSVSYSAVVFPCSAPLPHPPPDPDPEPLVHVTHKIIIIKDEWLIAQSSVRMPAVVHEFAAVASLRARPFAPSSSPAPDFGIRHPSLVSEPLEPDTKACQRHHCHQPPTTKTSLGRLSRGGGPISSQSNISRSCECFSVYK